MSIPSLLNACTPMHQSYRQSLHCLTRSHPRAQAHAGTPIHDRPRRCSPRCRRSGCRGPCVSLASERLSACPCESIKLQRAEPPKLHPVLVPHPLRLCLALRLSLHGHAALSHSDGVHLRRGPLAPALLSLLSRGRPVLGGGLRAGHRSHAARGRRAGLTADTCKGACSYICGMRVASFFACIYI